ncbi:MAG: MerR family transcriptional regulator [bacterium]
MEKLFTLKEIAEEIGVPESNLRYYRTRIGDFLPSVGRGRKRRYHADAVDVFKRTVELVQGGVPLSKVYTILAGEKAIVCHEDEPQRERENHFGLVLQKIAEKLEVFEKLLLLERKNATLEAKLSAALEDVSFLRSAQRKFIEELEGKNQKIIELQVSRDKLLRDFRDNEEGTLEMAGKIRKFNEEIEKKSRIIEHQREQLVGSRSDRERIAREINDVKKLLLGMTPSRSSYLADGKMPNSN